MDVDVHRIGKELVQDGFHLSEMRLDVIGDLLDALLTLRLFEGLGFGVMVDGASTDRHGRWLRSIGAHSIAYTGGPADLSLTLVRDLLVRGRYARGFVVSTAV